MSSFFEYDFDSIPLPPLFDLFDQDDQEEFSWFEPNESKDDDGSSESGVSDQNDDNAFRSVRKLDFQTLRDGKWTCVNKVRARLFALYLLLSQSLPSTRPTFMPAEQWQQLVDLKHANKLVKLIAGRPSLGAGHKISICLPEIYDILVLTLVCHGQNAESSISNTKVRLRWWSDPVGIAEIEGIRKHRVHKDSQLKYVSRSIPLPLHIDAESVRTTSKEQLIADLADFYEAHFEATFSETTQAERQALILDGFQNRKFVSPRSPTSFTSLEEFVKYGPHTRKWTRIKVI